MLVSLSIEFVLNLREITSRDGRSGEIRPEFTDYQYFGELKVLVFRQDSVLNSPETMSIDARSGQLRPE